MSRWDEENGAPLPLGLEWIEAEQAFNFALYSRHATAVTLLLFDAANLTVPSRQIPLQYLRHKTGRVWHTRVARADLGAAVLYGYSVDGAFAPTQGDRFDPLKVLLDPYARGIFFPLGYSRHGSMGAGSNAGRGPLGEVLAPAAKFDWANDRGPRHSHDTIVYEMHVRGFTRRANSGVMDAARGTFAGVVEKIPYLQELGVTVLELMPVCQFDPEEGGNYWGYMPLNFFAPHQTYASGNTGNARADEFRSMVKALHAAGIEVVLDVVYNHTSETGAGGPTYCYRGIDNGTYYLLGPDGTYRDLAGTGNVLRTSHPAVRRLITDSLRFWRTEMHVDGFRFDLASVFTRTDDGSISAEEPPILSEISGDPDFADSRLIGEPWDLDTYQLGRAFPGQTWAQWNGQFRDDLRSFVKGDGARVGDLMSRLYGSADLFPDSREEAFRPQQSINYVTCHDGFCLYDLVSFNAKHNFANGNNNRDGTDNNISWNCGVEGDSAAGPEVLALRRRQIKNFCCLLMLANGTPMFCAGDEFMNTQGGNNNPYNQDNETTWLDWDLLARNRDDMFRFFKRMIAFRKAHPSIGRGRFWREDIRWYGVGRDVDLSGNSHTLAYCLHGASERDRDLYVMINAYWETLTFALCEGAANEWSRAVDTSRDSPQDIVDAGREQPLTAGSYDVGPRSVVVLLRDRGT
jgi:glycogen operon protein